MKQLLRNNNPDVIDLSNDKPDLYYCKSKDRTLQAIAMNTLLRFL